MKYVRLIIGVTVVLILSCCSGSDKSYTLVCNDVESREISLKYNKDTLYIQNWYKTDTLVNKDRRYYLVKDGNAEILMLSDQEDTLMTRQSILSSSSFEIKRGKDGLNSTTVREQGFGVPERIKQVIVYDKNYNIVFIDEEEYLFYE